MRNKIVLFITGCISLMLISCLGSDDDYDSVVIKDAQIKSFTLKHDSVSGLSSVKFTIDQVRGLIFNKDSMPYGTEIEKVLCTLEYVSGGVAGVQVTQEAIPDSTYWWNGSDSLDFSKPVKFVTTAYDGQTTKTYTAQVNIHTLVPDSMVWGLYASNILGQAVDEQKTVHFSYQGSEAYFMYVKSSDKNQLYYSPVSDVKNWTELSLTGLPDESMLISQITEYEDKLFMVSSDGKLYQSINGLDWTITENTLHVKYILGTLQEGRLPSSLATIVDNEGSLCFAGMDKTGKWTVGDIVPDRFPVSGFGNLCYSNMHYDYLMIIAGRDRSDQLTNVAWSTMNSTAWVPLTDEKTNYFEKKEGVMLTKYDDKFCLLGGINTGGKASKEIHFSSDYGVTWHLSDTLVVFPNEYPGRGFSSVIVDKDNYMLLFGGKTSRNAKPLDEIWRGRINRLGFKD